MPRSGIILLCVGSKDGWRHFKYYNYMNNKYFRSFVGGIFCLGLSIANAMAADILLPNANDRFPSVTLDPFERQRAVVQAARKIQTMDTPSAASESQAVDTSVVVAPVIAAPVVTVADNSPPYSYSVFLDVDYVNKLSGGAQTSMSMGGDETESGEGEATIPAASAAVYLLHFYGEYDTGKAGLWDNGTIVAHIIYGGGNSPTNTVGDLRSTSNIDASFMDEQGNMVMPGLDILELWYEHRFPYNKSSVRIGAGYLSSDFYKSKYTGLFLNSGVGSIGTEILWNTMASNPPNTTLGLWYKTSMTQNVYWQLAAFDGFPDHSTDVFAVAFGEEEGVFTATELGLQLGSPKKDGYLKVGLGAWYLKQDMAKMMDQTMYMVGYEGYTGEAKQGTGGMYVVVDKAIDDDMGIFFKGGIAEDGINKYKRYFTTGVTYKGLLESRPSDVVGAAVVQSKLGDAYLEASGLDDDGNFSLFSHETIYEFTYSAKVNKWLMVQPDLQYVLQPSMNPMNLNSWVATIRAEITIK